VLTEQKAEPQLAATGPDASAAESGTSRRNDPFSGLEEAASLLDLPADYPARMVGAVDV
jgi:hypothetical protein